ncbi:BTB/POZ domain protein [Rhizoctonia solani 123E]|uniref:BTB/POZ domain protein n=1 Tax=Rhizoctonia solani 123E TaxID=1423351 RepID=A0A074RXL1_9AGAM|nr:BTB/POZ domain protein [Rhizoctonia solani 123E]
MDDSTRPHNEDPLPRIRDSKFFFEDSMVVIQIEDVRFKVHKSILMESEVFSDMFTVAEDVGRGGKNIEGSSADYPIKLEGVNASDFECLLELLYEKHYTPQHPELDIPLALSAFRLAHMWNFTELRACLLPHLDGNLDDVDKIVYAREFDIKEWIIPAYIKLCHRTKPLNSEEAEKIGLKGAMLVFRLRESYISAGCQYCLGRNVHVTCLSCRNNWLTDSNGTAKSDKSLEEKIKAWEKDGQVFL